MSEPITKPEVINIVYGIMNDLKKKVTEIDSDIGKLKSYVNDHKNSINAILLAQAELLGTVEEMKTKLFDDDAGILTQYLQERKEKRMDRRAIWVGIIVGIIGMIAANVISMKVFISKLLP